MGRRQPQSYSDEAFISAFEKTGSYLGVSQMLGCAMSTASKRLQELGHVSSSTGGWRKPPALEAPIERPEPLTNEAATSWEEILESASRHARDREAQSPSKLLGTVKVKSETPIGVFLISDLHLGSPQCDYLTFLRHVSYLKNIPNLYAIIQGDVLEYAISQRMLDSVLSQVMSPQEQARVWKSIVDDLCHKLLAAIIGNHELRAERLSGFDLGEYMYQSLIKNKVGVYMKDGGTLRLKVGSQEYTWRVTHGDSRFGSMYNPNHKNMQLSRMSFGFHDIQSTGHTHDGAVQVMNAPRPDGEGTRQIVSLQASSYKTLGAEQYPDRLGFAKLAEVQMPMVILYPNERVVLPFLRVEEGVKVLRGLTAPEA